MVSQKPSPEGEGGAQRRMRGKPAIFPVYGFLPEGLPSSVGFADSFSLRAKSRLRRLRFDTRLRAQPRGGSRSTEKNCKNHIDMHVLLW